MKIRDLGTSQLAWSQPSARRQEYELRASGELAATLKFRSLFGSLATAESADGCWTFKRVGFWQQRVSVRHCGSDVDAATFTNNTWQNGGTLEFVNGRQFRATTNFWNTKFEFRTAADEPLVRLHYGGVFRLAADVEIYPAAFSMDELPVVVLIAWYLAVMLHRDAGAAAAAG